MSKQQLIIFFLINPRLSLFKISLNHQLLDLRLKLFHHLLLKYFLMVTFLKIILN
ncbi:144R [Invertebrate iridescent virus Kaz2018]|uniref:144R n=1 Tax=Invertebrate iridescent virus 6 TaxID=176652 RepID=Q91G03_IIV6|nr:144R [Invertebrate iridescent virus 6]AAK82029.1 144R [Invertebrate iridescent virus 6]QMS79420.1 hypothetical protein IIV6-T1_148 [Invertebrate iridescent virus 6]QNH08554.1 144R [Invertebrate iridescent virus Kaz2018]